MVTVMKMDCHMHTPLCGHALGEPVEYVRSAARQGLELVTFTCHIPMDEDFGGVSVRMREEQLPQYFDWIKEAAREGDAMGVEVLTGIEGEIFPEEERLQAMDVILAGYPFDFVLGSLHHQLPVFRSWLKTNGIETDAEIVDVYFRNLAAGVRSRRYDSIAHPDVIRIYGTVSRFEPAEHEESIRGFLEAVVESNTCMEVNTSGLTKGVFQVHPDPLILSWAAEMGVSLTLGSDAHRPEAVGQFFGDIYPLLKQSGFDRTHYFRRREQHAVPIPV